MDRKSKYQKSIDSKKHLTINGKEKKTTAKHLKKIVASNKFKKNGILCSTCNQLLNSSHYSQKQRMALESHPICKKCETKSEKKARNKAIIKEIHLKMCIEPTNFTKSHLPLSHETRERRKNKGAFRVSILERDQHLCHYCGDTGDTIDHLVPVAKGGFTTLENCVTSCEFCNHIKGDIDIEVFKKGLTYFEQGEWASLKSLWSK